MWWFWANVLVSAIPPGVGLVFLLTHPGRGRWRLWGLLGFGLGLASSIGFALLNTVFFWSAGAEGGRNLSVLGPVSFVLQATSLIASGFVVAAVLTDRRTERRRDETAPPQGQPVVQGDPLAYDPVDFERPHHTT